jgi:exonuclease III
MTNAFHLNIMTWNVRGLNDKTKRIAVRKQIMLHIPNIITLQETKLGDINREIINESVGRSYDCELHNDVKEQQGDTGSLEITDVNQISTNTREIHHLGGLGNEYG